ncbi:hypothetical protein ACFL2T_05130, partial [Elusimicrobiota bacterium]
REHIRRCYEVADRLVEGVERANRDGCLKAEDTFLVFGSDVYASGWAKPGEDFRHNLMLRDMEPMAVLNEASDWLHSDVL